MAGKNAVAGLAARKAGWTLVELLVAVAISSILFAALGGAVALAHRSIDGWEKKLYAARRPALLFGCLERDLLFAAPVPMGRDVAFEGTRDAISFWTGQEQVRVRFSPAQGAIDRLKEKAAQPLILLDGVEKAFFSFLGKDGWEREWSRAGWPAAIRIEGVFRDPSRGEVAFEKTFYPIPQ